MNPDHRSHAGPNPAEAAEIRAAAIDWIQRRATGMSAAEREEFRRWLAADPRHSAMLARMNSAGDDCDWMWHAGAVGEVVAALEQRKTSRRRRQAIAFAGAATVLVLLAFVWQGRPSAPNAGTTSASTLVVVEPQRRALPDGSVVELKTGAEIAVDFSGTLRRVTLQRGEAHFAVAKDGVRPFIVAAAGVEVCALGTVFAVELKRSTVEVLVTEGRVAVERVMEPRDQRPETRDLERAAETGKREAEAEGAERSDFRVGESPPPRVSASFPDPSLPQSLNPLFVDAGNRVSVPVADPAAPPVVPVSETELTERLGWRIPRLEFTAMPLREVVAHFNRHNRVQFVLDDPTVGELRVSGVLRADRIDSLIEMIESDFAVKAERPNDREIRLRRKR